VAYAPVYFPGTVDVSAASPVTVVSGQEPLRVDFAAELIPTARIEGTIIDPSGQPPRSAQASLTSKADMSLIVDSPIAGEIMIQPRPTVVEAGLSIAGVPPGAYTLTSAPLPESALAPPIAPSGRGPAPTMTLWATADISVNGQDVSGLTVRLQPGMTVSGRIAFDAGTLQPPADLSRISVQVSPTSTSPACPPAVIARRRLRPMARSR
jgi:hypothetical protein